MNIVKFVFNPLEENTFVVWDETLEAIIIDAGNSNSKENERLAAFIDEQGLKPVMAVNTHGHFDHILGVQFLKERYGVKFAMSSKDEYLLGMMSENFAYFCSGTTLPAPEIDIDIEHQPSIEFGNTELKIIRTPGHTPGGVCLYHQPSKQMFTGDTLFRESIGRSDLPGGDYHSLMHSILNKLINLGDEVTIYPGHAEKSSIGHESLYNPFVVEAINGEINF